jgi:DNA end-binding protein Ku
MRSMWKGAISFGLVMIPVKLYAATEQRDVTFRQVHQEDGGRIRFQRVCSVCGREVPYADVAKGYELPDGEMVVLTDDDFADLPLPSTRSIDVVQFTPAEQVDPILHGRSYYTEPDQVGTRAYVLLRDALEDSGMVAIARVALRQRESLAALRVRDGVIVLDTLLWPDEVRTPDFKFLDEDVPVRQQELKMAASLIDSMTSDFDPDEFHDGYREALEELVSAKVAGREVAAPVVPISEEAAGSLAEALRASLAAAQGSGRGAGSGRGTAAGRGAGTGAGAGGRRRSARTADQTAEEEEAEEAAPPPRRRAAGSGGGSRGGSGGAGRGGSGGAGRGGSGGAGRGGGGAAGGSGRRRRESA